MRFMFNHPYRFPGNRENRKSGILVSLFLVSVVFFVLAKVFPIKEADKLKSDMLQASELMSDAVEILKRCRTEKDLSPNLPGDINLTGLLGLEFSEITTSVGQLEAKRTSFNPNFAGLVVMLLQRAGVKSGDTIAVGASGSFPALTLAVCAASEVMEIKALIIGSLGASQWGANLPDFHWLKMYECLFENGIYSSRPIAVSLGGDRDIGENMQQEGRSGLLEDIEKSQLEFIYESDLPANVALRLSLYEQAASGAEIRAFINIGGSFANIGTDSKILNLRPGLTKVRKFPVSERQGVLFAMANRGIPIIHLLYLQGLVKKYGLPWDPVPLPRSGEGQMYRLLREGTLTFFLFSLLFLLIITMMIISVKRKTKT